MCFFLPEKKCITSAQGFSVPERFVNKSVSPVGKKQYILLYSPKLGEHCGISSLCPINTRKMVVHTEVFWKLKTHIKMRHYGCFKLTSPKSVLKLYSRYIPFHPRCKSLVPAWDSYSRLLQSPFYFLFLRGQNFTHNSGLNPRCRKQVLILQDLTIECASRCGGKHARNLWASLLSTEILLPEGNSFP